jgi:hypothetical protein
VLVAVAVVALGVVTVALRMQTAKGPETLPTPALPGGDDAREGIGERTGIANVEAVAEQQTAASDPGASSSSWASLYWDSKDRFAFAEAAAVAALAGDSRAQYYLSLTLLDCSVQVGLTAPMGRGSVSANIEARFEGTPRLREYDRERIRSQVMRCERFFNESPFANLSLPEEAQTHQYWFDRAVAAGDPLAVMDRALKAVVQGSSSSEDAETRRTALLSDVRVAVEAKDSTAIAKVGFLYSLQDVGRNHSFQGPAWLIAACELGYDCSMRNPEILGECVEGVGICNSAFTLADMFTRDLGATRFGEIYAASQDIVYKINADDWDGLQQYLETKL